MPKIYISHTLRDIPLTIELEFSIFARDSHCCVLCDSGVATSTSLVERSATDAMPHVPMMAARQRLVVPT